MQDHLLLPTGVRRALRRPRPRPPTNSGSDDDDNDTDWVDGDIIEEGGNIEWWLKLLIGLAAAFFISACISLFYKCYAKCTGTEQAEEENEEEGENSGAQNPSESKHSQVQPVVYVMA